MKLQNLRQLRFRAEPLGTGLHFHGQGETVDALGESGVVIDFVRHCHLPAGGQLFQNQGLQPGSRGIEGGGVSAGASADDDHIVNVLHDYPSSRVSRMKASILALDSGATMEPRTSPPR